MVFSSFIFISVFLPLVLAAYFLLPKKIRNLVLVIASLAFYTWGEARTSLALIVLLTTVNFYLGKLIGEAQRERRKRLIVFAVALNLGVLIVFKYAAFVLMSLNEVLALGDLPTLPVPRMDLPLGISFFTFHSISCLVDIYRGLFPPQRSFTGFFLYIVNFPQLIAGPIIRYRQIVNQLGSRTVGYSDFEYGVLRFTGGLGKKLLLADPVGAIADSAVGIPTTDLTTAAAWLCLACYTLQIYFDFSGYSDMAVGLARMFGFRFPENFHYPYAAPSVQDFLRRWHLTLSAWFRDYVYIPLGGNRGGTLATFRNLWIVFFLTGAWHGASWNFIVWGMWHGFFLALERLGPVARVMEATPHVLRNAYVLLIVMIGWVFFRANDLPHAIAYLRRMFAFDPVVDPPIRAFDLVTSQTLVAIALTSCFAFPLWAWVKDHWWRRIDERNFVAGGVVRSGFLAAVVIPFLSAMGIPPTSPL